MTTQRILQNERRYQQEEQLLSGSPNVGSKIAAHLAARLLGL